MSGGPDDVRALAGARLAEYVELWGEASAKLGAGTYRSDDLVADWYRWFGMAVRDTTAAVTLAMRAAGAPGPAGPDGPDRPGSAEQGSDRGSDQGSDRGG